MKKPAILLSVIFAFSILLSSCSGEAKDEIVGTWEAIDVSASVNDYTNIKDDVLDQTLDYYRTVNFEFFEDFTMNIVSSGSSFPGSWKFFEDDNEIFIRMEQHEAKDYKKFGVLANDTIVSTNVTGLGTIVVKYVKSSDYN